MECENHNKIWGLFALGSVPGTAPFVERPRLTPGPLSLCALSSGIASGLPGRLALFSDDVLAIFLDITLEFAMSYGSQKRALQNYRKRLNARGIARFEVLGLDADRELIRSLARRLAEKGPEATRIRATVRRTIASEPRKKGGILAALLRSPLVGADLDVTRSTTHGRKVDL